MFYVLFVVLIALCLYYAIKDIVNYVLCPLSVNYGVYGVCVATFDVTTRTRARACGFQMM